MCRLAVPLLLAVPLAAPAQLWIQDPAFGAGGSAIIDISTGNDEVQDLLVLPGDAILLAGWTSLFSIEADLLTVIKLGADGEPDMDFGDGGYASYYHQPGSAFGRAIARRSDGRLVVAGGTIENTNVLNGLLVGLLPNGQPDPDFGVDGAVAIDINGSEALHAVEVLADGSILAAGRNGSAVLVVKCDAQGGLDPAFGSGGVAEFVFTSASPDQPVRMAVLPGGGIVLAAAYATGPRVLKLDANGGLDPAFGTGGIVTLPAGTSMNAMVHAAGRILVGGGGASSSDPNDCEGYRIVALNAANGSLDTGFGNGGAVDLWFSNDCQEVFGMAADGLGRILACGDGTTGPGGSDFSIARLLPDGTLDNTFGNAGVLFSDLGCEGIDVAYGVALQSSGAVLLAGVSNCADFPNDAAVLRLIEDIGSSAAEAVPAFGASVFPNPTLGNATLAFDVPADGRLTIAVYDAQGRLVQGATERLVRTGTLREELVLEDRAPGTYLVAVSMAGRTERLRLVKL